MTLVLDEPELILDTRSTVGEGALWDSRQEVLWWIDIFEGLLHCYDPSSGENRTWEFGRPIGTVGAEPTQVSPKKNFSAQVGLCGPRAERLGVLIERHHVYSKRHVRVIVCWLRVGPRLEFCEVYPFELRQQCSPSFPYWRFSDHNCVQAIPAQRRFTLRIQTATMVPSSQSRR
jgi:hypothetical protein